MIDIYGSTQHSRSLPRRVVVPFKRGEGEIWNSIAHSTSSGWKHNGSSVRVCLHIVLRGLCEAPLLSCGRSNGGSRLIVFLVSSCAGVTSNRLQCISSRKRLIRGSENRIISRNKLNVFFSQGNIVFINLIECGP